MSLYKKLVTLVALIIAIILTLTLTIVYFVSQSIMVGQAQQKAISIIQTIDSALESNIPDFQFESILMHLKQQDPQILSFDIYKLNQYFYDIASTDPKRIGTQSNAQSLQAVMKKTVETTVSHGVLEIASPIHVNGQTLYSASVRFSITKDLQLINRLLVDVLAVGLIAMVLALFGVWLFTRMLLSKPLVSMIHSVDDIAEGNLRIELSSEKRRQDEIGALARSFIKMATTLRNLIAGIAQASEQLNLSFQELVTSGDRTARGALHVSDVMGHVTQAMALQLQQLESATQACAALLATVDSIVVESDQAMEMMQGAWQGTGGENLVGARGEASQLVERVQQAVVHLAEVSASIRDVSAASTPLLSSLQLAMDTTRDCKEDLANIAATANGQFSSIQDVNRSAAHLREMAMAMQKMIAEFDVSPAKSVMQTD